jgi:acetyl esterase/lipase
MDLDFRTDDTHRFVLSLIPPDLFDFSDLQSGIDRVRSMLAAASYEIPDSVTVEDRRVTAADGHEVVVRLYRPASMPTDVPAPALYWIHGGGMILGDVSMDDDHCVDLALRAQIIVASVDYRLAPEWPYPTPLDDCQAGLRWLVDEADTLGIDRDRIAIGGGSAGGGLAAGLALRLRDLGGFQPCLQLLRYPMLDDRNDTTSSHEITDGRVWNRDANLAGWRAYLGDQVGAPDLSQDAAPARATVHAGLPPAIVTVGCLDLFLDEDLAYARALMAAGVPTDVHVYAPSFHGADRMVAHAESSQRWRRDELEALQRAFAAPLSSAAPSAE